MLTTQFYDAAGAPGFRNAGFGDLGAIPSTAGTAALQTYLKSIGKLGASSVTGVMNDATMGVIFNMLIESAATVGKIPLLPADIRNGINTVVNALKSADSKIKSISYNQASLSSVIRNWLTINAAVRLIPYVGESAANAMAAARDAVYNAVASQASIIQKAIAIFVQPAASTGTTAIQPDMAILTAFLQPSATFTTMSPSASPASVATVPGTIYAFSKKLGKYRIAIPRTYGAGFGILADGVFNDCVFGDCGLGATAPFTEVAPSSTPPAGGTPTTETDLEKKTGTLPLYKKWQFWAAVGGGAAVVGTGTVLLVRRKKVAASATRSA